MAPKPYMSFVSHFDVANTIWVKNPFLYEDLWTQVLFSPYPLLEDQASSLKPNNNTENKQWPLIRPSPLGLQICSPAISSADWTSINRGDGGPTVPMPINQGPNTYLTYIDKIPMIWKDVCANRLALIMSEKNRSVTIHCTIYGQNRRKSDAAQWLCSFYQTIQYAIWNARLLVIFGIHYLLVWIPGFHVLGDAGWFTFFGWFVPISNNICTQIIYASYIIHFNSCQ